MKKKLHTVRGTSKKKIEEGYEEILGEEYLRLPKRAKEDLYKRYKAIEGATREYYGENQRKTKKRDARDI